MMLVLKWRKHKIKLMWKLSSTSVLGGTLHIIGATLPVECEYVKLLVDDETKK